MKERPILFSAPMVRALMAGTKTQTRRVVKPQFKPDAIPVEIGATNEQGHQIAGHSGIWWCDAEGNAEESVRCPHGQPGDRLWVRESWHQRGKFVFALPDSDKSLWLGTREIAYSADAKRPGHDWRSRPSIHMPRWASRITLEVTGVRVERLQEINIEDAKAEGAWGPDDSIVQKVADYFGTDIFSANPRKAFQMLWESINGPDSWAANPWVWVIEFRSLP